MGKLLLGAYEIFKFEIPKLVIQQKYVIEAGKIQSSPSFRGLHYYAFTFKQEFTQKSPLIKRNQHNNATNINNRINSRTVRYIQLYIPGHVLHLTEEYDGKDEHLQIAGDWIENKPLQHIVLSRQMINDHLPKRVERIVKREPLVWWMKILPGEIIDAFY